MSDIPSLKEELNRKTFETVNKLVHERGIGKITDAQYDYGVETLWSAVAGLADSDFMDIAAEMRLVTKKDESFNSKVYLRNARGDTAVITNYHNGTVRMTVYRSGVSEPVKQQDYDLREETQAMLQAAYKVNELALKLEANGFYSI